MTEICSISMCSLFPFRRSEIGDLAQLDSQSGQSSLPRFIASKQTCFLAIRLVDSPTGRPIQKARNIQASLATEP